VKQPGTDCALCPRLVAFREDNRQRLADFHNAPVASFGPADAAVLVVGLAPGLRGANRTGRPFTGDAAGDLLYPTLLAHGFAEGAYGARHDDGLAMRGCRITNAVRCVPPDNKPIGAEVKACRDFLRREIDAMPHLRLLLALGRIAHDAVLAARNEKRKDHPFSHGGEHTLGDGLILFDSYHCSRYNTNTGRLTPAMFDAVFADIRNRLADPATR
jgi:uracil-DNA glycosylase family 4